VAAELPVREVILYKHGVGYFERSGELAPGESARLDFKPAEMNDVLKSLTLETVGADKVTALRYDLSEPIERKLAGFPIKLEPGRPLSQLLDQLKGARLEVKYASGTHTGAIVSARVIAAEGEHPEREQVTLLTDTAALQTLDLSSGASVHFVDPALQSELKDYLAAVSGARSKEHRSVYIDSTDSSKRQVTASYMIPTPVWKSSYRLIFGTAGEPTLEGWAIVDNTTSDDWTNVRLALVSGRPISFITQLYEPKYVARPIAELPEDRARAPVVHEGGVVGGVIAGVAGAPPAPPPAPKMEARAFRRKEAAGLSLADEHAAVESTIAATAESRELGELFEYRFDKPVTVRKSESAMLPFLQQKVGARKLLIYADESSRHPMNAAEITNSTGKTLDGGPVTVFDAGAYAGEALVETLKGGDKRLISYGIDLGTRITTVFDSSSERIQQVSLRRGVLTAFSGIREVKTYTIRNVDQKPKTLVVEHPARPTYKLLNQKPAEQTANAYRFEVKLGPDSTEKFVVEEERSLVNTYALVNESPDFLASFVQNKELSAEARKQLERILAHKREIASIDTQIQEGQTQINELVNDQGRLRENIRSLNSVSGQQDQVQKYAAQLASQESALAAQRDRLAEMRKKRNALQAELNTMIETMEF
jgi:hypothetical protein